MSSTKRPLEHTISKLTNVDQNTIAGMVDANTSKIVADVMNKPQSMAEISSTDGITGPAAIRTYQELKNPDIAMKNENDEFTDEQADGADEFSQSPLSLRTDEQIIDYAKAMKPTIYLDESSLNEQDGYINDQDVSAGDVNGDSMINLGIEPSIPEEQYQSDSDASADVQSAFDADEAMNGEYSGM